MKLSCVAERNAKLRSILRQEFALSSTLVKRLKFRDAYTVNGRPVHTDYPVQIGDVVSVNLCEAAPDYPAEDGPLQILYEDAAIIAIDKPAGMLVHPSSARNTGTLANRLIGYYAKTGQSCAVHPVSRLDRDTFGIVLLAKNAHIHARFCAMSKAGAIEKRYQAFVFGRPPQDEGEIDAPIAREREGCMLRCVRSDGKPARSRYRVLQTWDCCTLLELQPLTGRTHQLRLHCAYAGFPILGDPQYHSEASLACSDALGLRYQQLCAVSLRFVHPLSQQPLALHTAFDLQKIGQTFLSGLDFCRTADI